MKANLIPLYLIFTWFLFLPGQHVGAQEPVHRQLQEQVQTQVHEGVFTLVDFVDLPLGIQGLPDTLCSLEFLEEWIIEPSEASLDKKVLDQDSSCMSLWMKLPERKGLISLRDLTYEFMLLDPHLIASGNMAFQEPDSMDLPTRKLQSYLIDLITNLSETSNEYLLEDQLLSLIFHEDWSLNPDTRQIRKKVRGITPVIWQRRQTVTGEPINDGVSGLPVYFKMQLERINLRNP